MHISNWDVNSQGPNVKHAHLPSRRLANGKGQIHRRARTVLSSMDGPTTICASAVVNMAGRKKSRSQVDGEDPLFLNDPPARVLLACPRRFVRFTNSPQQCPFVIAGSEGDPNWQKAVNGISSACGVFPRAGGRMERKISTFKDNQKKKCRNPVLPANELTFDLGGRWEHKHNCD